MSTKNIFTCNWDAKCLGDESNVTHDQFSQSILCSKSMQGIVESNYREDIVVRVRVHSTHAHVLYMRALF